MLVHGRGNQVLAILGQATKAAVAGDSVAAQSHFLQAEAVLMDALEDVRTLAMPSCLFRVWTALSFLLLFKNKPVHALQEEGSVDTESRRTLEAMASSCRERAGLFRE